MSRGLRFLSAGLGIWALLSVMRAIDLAGDLAAEGATPATNLWVELMIWALPVVLGGFVAVGMVSWPGGDQDIYLARNVRMGVMVAIFAVALSWAMVLYAGYLQTLGQR